MKLKKDKSPHCVIRNSNLFCTHCGQEHIINYPMEVSKVTSAMDSFCTLHKDCEKTWRQPEADLTQSIPERAVWWVVHGEHGTSAKTIWNVLSQGKMSNVKMDYEYLKRVILPPSQYGHPDDPSAFHRCYLLLKAIPEWRSELHKLSKVSPVWEKVVANWDKLSEMLEEQIQTDGVNGMYDFMKTLNC